MKKKGQSLLEYATLVGIIAVVFSAMSIPFQRSVQRVIKEVSDILGVQSEAEQASNIEEGYMANARTDAQISSSKTTVSNATRYAIDEYESMNTASTTVTNLGITPDESWTP